MNDDTRTEAELIAIVRNAVNDNNWLIGDCANAWCDRWAQGKTIRDFAAMVGLSADQVSARLRVYQRFDPECAEHVISRVEFKALAWSHFHAAVAWEDAQDCLTWAQDNDSSVAEMRAYHRMNNGEDMTASDARRATSDLADNEDENERREELEPNESEQPNESYAPFRDADRDLAVGEVSDSNTQDESEDEPKDSRELTRMVIFRIRTNARRLQRVLDDKADKAKLLGVLRDELESISDDLRAEREIEGLDKETLDAALARPTRRLRLEPVND